MIMLKLWNVKGFWGTLGLGVGEGSLYSMVPKHSKVKNTETHLLIYFCSPNEEIKHEYEEEDWEYSSGININFLHLNQTVAFRLILDNRNT